MIEMRRFPNRRLVLLAIICSGVLLGQIPFEVLGQTYEVALTHSQSFEFETVDDVFSNSPVDGTLKWWLSTRNNEKASLKEPSIEVLTQLPSDSFRGMDPQPNSTTQKGSENLYAWNLEMLPPQGRLGVWLGGKSYVTFTPGFDSRRELSPTIIESELTNQTVVVTVVPRESLSQIVVDVQLDPSSAVSASLIISSLRPKDAYIYDDKTGVGWRVDNPEPNRSYEFSVILALKNRSYPEKVFYKPRVIAAALEHPPEEMGYKGASVVAKDSTLGAITYSATGTHQWSYYHEIIKEIRHKTATGSPLVSLTIENPHSLSVVKGTLRVQASAFSSTGMILDMRCSLDGGGWVPMELGNATDQQLFARQGMGRAGWIEWDTTKMSNGGHEITIRAQDTNDISDNKTITVIVDNSGPKFIGYSQVTNFASVVAIVIAIVGVVWIKSRRTRKFDASKFSNAEGTRPD